MHLSLWDTLPFLGILLSIAVLPPLAPRFWHRHYPSVAAGWGLAFAVPFLARFRGEAAQELLHVALADYLPFLVILWGLFVVAGGVEVEGALRGTPGANVLLLLTGTGLASLVGTTGASILLIRPLLRANAHRKHRARVVVFFIFLVSNAGGCLTPLGDPPLFLGFLQGVPFFWTLRLLPHAAVLATVLITAFYVADARDWRKERLTGAPTGPPAAPLRLRGGGNLVLLVAILFCVWLSGAWRGGEVNLLGAPLPVSGLVRDGAIVLLGIVSLRRTPAGLRERIGFGWGPMREVAILFAAIFVTIVPAMILLRTGESGPLGWLIRALRTPSQFYWATGLLSSVLDNAPTYLTMLHTQLGRFYPGVPTPEAVHLLVAERADHLVAISAGAVFMGALTYIGNAPNFMVKAIAEEAGVAMPTFFGYLLRWALPLLLPALALVAWLLI